MKRKTRANGTGTACKRGRTWTVEVVLGWDAHTGRPIRATKGGFPTKTAALLYAPMLKGGPKKRSSGPKTLYSYWTIWESSAFEKLSKSKQTAYRIAWRKLSRIQYIPLSQIDVETLQNTLNEQAPTYYPARDIRTLLSHLYKLAIADGEVTVDMPSILSIPALTEGEPTPFTLTEVSSFWTAYESGDDIVGYILLMIYTGMMPGELCLLEKDMIDWDAHTIHGCGIKTRERKRKPLVLADFILPVLHDLCQRSTGRKVLRMNRDRFYAEFHAALARCGARDLTPYACRHTTATALATGAKVAPSIIQRIMRHSKFETTQRYIHPDNTAALEAVNALDITLPGAGNAVGSNVGSKR